MPGREGFQRPLVTPPQLLALPSLVELRALLRRPQGAGGPLEAVSEALCGARGPGISGGPSLGWHEAGHLKELVGQEALPDSGLSESRPPFPFGNWGDGRGGGPHGAPAPQARPALSSWGPWRLTRCPACSGGA